MSDLLRVLLIDDDEDSAPLTRGMLSRVVGLNFDVEWAPDFEMGLERLLSNAHDVCLVSCDGRDWRGFLGEFVRLKVAAQKEQEMAWQGHLLGRMEFVLCPDRDLMIDAELGNTFSRLLGHPVQSPEHDTLSELVSTRQGDHEDHTSLPRN